MHGLGGEFQKTLEVGVTGPSASQRASAPHRHLPTAAIRPCGEDLEGYPPTRLSQLLPAGGAAGHPTNSAAKDPPRDPTGRWPCARNRAQGRRGCRHRVERPLDLFTFLQQGGRTTQSKRILAMTGWHILCRRLKSRSRACLGTNSPANMVLHSESSSKVERTSPTVR